jgi:hypothetical protein
MPSKKGTRKTSTPIDESKAPEPMEPEIDVQDPHMSQEREHAAPEASSKLPENLLTITDPDDTPFTMIEDHLYNALRELQELHDTARKTKATNITMERIMFTKIATEIQKAWEQIKTLHRPHEESLILKSIKHIQASITGLE